MFLLYSNTYGMAGEENHLDKHCAHTKGEQQSFGNDLSQHILSMVICNVSPIYICQRSLVQYTNTLALNLFNNLPSKWEGLIGGRL